MCRFICFMCFMLSVGVKTLNRLICAYFVKPMAFVENLILCKVNLQMNYWNLTAVFLNGWLERQYKLTTWTVGVSSPILVCHFCTCWSYEVVCLSSCSFFLRGIQRPCCFVRSFAIYSHMPEASPIEGQLSHVKWGWHSVVIIQDVVFAETCLFVVPSLFLCG